MTAAIETMALTKRYGELCAVDGLTVTVEAGEVFGFLGPNGAGKSTTIRTLVGLQRPTSGRALILGLDAWADQVEVHRRLGYLPGELALFPKMTGRRHLDWFLRARRIERPRDLGELVERLGAELDRPVDQLSKGNRQKIGILLAVMARPDILILDEPSSGLDPLVQHEFHELLREAAAEGRTVFLSSHELAEVQQVADRVAIIRDGRLVVTDTVDNLRAGAPRIVRTRFRAPVNPRTWTGMAGVQVVHCDGPEVTMAVTGDIGPLLRVIADLDPVDLIARPADLDELFRAYYQPEDAAHAH